MNSDPNRTALLAALDRSSGDKIAQAALADWFEEQGDIQSAQCLRWVIRNNRRPGSLDDRYVRYGKFFWELQEPEPLLGDSPAQLPKDLWLVVSDNEEPHSVCSFKSYKSPQAAFLALVRGWKQLGRSVPEMPQ